MKKTNVKLLMNINLRKVALFWCFPILSLVLFSCENKPTDKNAEVGDASTITIPNEATVVATAKDFTRIYLKGKNAEAFLIQANDMMNGDFAPRFNIHQNRWYVFFTDGLNSLTVTMSKDLTVGTVRGLNAKVISSQAGVTHPKDDSSDVPLFTLSEFEKVVNLPNNQ
jgi:hypothetical protein